MGKQLFITEKPSVAREFAKALQLKSVNRDGYIESETAIITWCVGHLVTMCYPESYDEKLKRWTFDTLPFIPQEYRYQVIDNVKKQFQIIKGLFHRADIDVIYNCGDSGREGEYIQRLVLQMAGYNPNVKLKRVWIDSQTEDEILRGIREAKDASEYDNLANAAYLRAKEDYLMGINFSRVLTLKYGNQVKNYLKADKGVVSVGRVMTCVLGIVVNREREIREFVKTPFYRVLGKFNIGEREFDGEWKSVEGSHYFQSPLLYKENGFKERQTARELIAMAGGRLDKDFSNGDLSNKDLPEKAAFANNTPDGQSIGKDDAENIFPAMENVKALVELMEKKKEKKNPPLLYNLAELQNDCSKFFKITPDETLRIVQEMYEKKLVTYPRTDARVLSTAVAKEIAKNLSGLRNYVHGAPYAEEILKSESYKKILKSRYVNDKLITDHYAIIPTGQGLNALTGVHPTAQKVYEIITRRFFSIFYPPAVYQKINLSTSLGKEKFFASFKVLIEEGYLPVTHFSFSKKAAKSSSSAERAVDTQGDDELEKDGDKTEEEVKCDAAFLEILGKLKKGMEIPVELFTIKEGETSPPKRYNSGSMILTMENAGQFIGDEELRAQIKGSGIGTSATRAEILKKLVHIKYLSLNKKTQIITPTLLGEMIYDVVNNSIRPLLNPALTASWEKGLTGVAEGSISEEEYMKKLKDFVTRHTLTVKSLNNQTNLYDMFDRTSNYYKTGKK